MEGEFTLECITDQCSVCESTWSFPPSTDSGTNTWNIGTCLRWVRDTESRQTQQIWYMLEALITNTRNHNSQAVRKIGELLPVTTYSDLLSKLYCQIRDYCWWWFDSACYDQLGSLPLLIYLFSFIMWKWIYIVLHHRYLSTTTLVPVPKQSVINAANIWGRKDVISYYLFSLCNILPLGPDSPLSHGNDK